MYNSLKRNVKFKYIYFNLIKKSKNRQITRRLVIFPWQLISDIEPNGHLCLTADSEIMYKWRFSSRTLVGNLAING